MPSGYSGKRLIKKLGIKPGFSILTFGAPDSYWDWLGSLPEGVQHAAPGERVDFIHCFGTRSEDLANRLREGKDRMKRDGLIWLSWPKKASGVRSDLDESRVRKMGLDSGLVDIKICAVDETWSGLKFVIPLKDR